MMRPASVLFFAALAIAPSVASAQDRPPREDLRGAVAPAEGAAPRPPYAAPPEAPENAASQQASALRVRLLAGGVVVAVLGAVGLGVGLAQLESVAPPPACKVPSTGGTLAGDIGTAGSAAGCLAASGVTSETSRFGPSVLATMGGITLGAGVVMAIVGATMKTEPPRAVPAVSVDPRSAGLKWTF